MNINLPFSKRKSQRKIDDDLSIKILRQLRNKGVGFEDNITETLQSVNLTENSSESNILNVHNQRVMELLIYMSKIDLILYRDLSYKEKDSDRFEKLKIFARLTVNGLITLNNLENSDRQSSYQKLNMIFVGLTAIFIFITAIEPMKRIYTEQFGKLPQKEEELKKLHKTKPKNLEVGFPSNSNLYPKKP